MKDLQQQISDILARLSTLSEAPASTLEPRTSHGKASSRVPTGVGDRIGPSDPERPPPKGRSLYDWFRWQFEHADPDDPERIERLLQLADMEYKARAVHAPRRLALRSGQLDGSTSRDRPGDNPGAWPAPAPLEPRPYGDDEDRPNASEEEEAKRAQEIVDWYEGFSPVQVAFVENTTEVWVRKARKKHSRNPEDGRKVPPFLQWDDEERRRQIDLLRARAKSEGRDIGAKTIANHFGVDKNTVKRYLTERPVAA